MTCRVCHEHEEAFCVQRSKKTGPILTNVWCCAECHPRVEEACTSSGETVRTLRVMLDETPRRTMEQIHEAETAAGEAAAGEFSTVPICDG